MINILYKIIKDVDKCLLKESGVYQIKNKNNDKIYIGSTSGRFSRRLTSHIRELAQKIKQIIVNHSSQKIIVFEITVNKSEPR